MDSRCIKSSIDFLFPQSKFDSGIDCTPLILIKSTNPSRIKKDKIKLLKEEVDETQEYNFICSLIEIEDWLSSKTLIANCIFDTKKFDSCENLDSKLPTKQTFYCKRDKFKAVTALTTPRRILASKTLDVLDFQSQNSKRKLKPDEYYGIIHKWLKKT